MKTLQSEIVNAKINLYLALLKSKMPYEKWWSDEQLMFEVLSRDPEIINYLATKLDKISPTPRADLFRKVLNLDEE